MAADIKFVRSSVVKWSIRCGGCMFSIMCVCVRERECCNKYIYVKIFLEGDG